MACLTPLVQLQGFRGDSRGKNRSEKCVKVHMQRYIEDINFKEMTYNDIIVIR